MKIDSKKVFWIFCFGVIMSALVFLLLSTVSPKPVRLVKPSYFNSPEQVGKLIWERYQDKLKKEPIWILGVESGSGPQMRILRSLVEAAESNGLSFEKKYKETRMNIVGWPELSGWTDINLQREFATFKSELKSGAESSKRGIYLMPSTFVSHLIGVTPVRKAEYELKKKFLSLSTVRFVLSMEDLGNLYPHCDGRAAFGEPSVAALGCATKRTSISTFRKKMDRNRHVMSMEQNGEKDYLVYFWSPEDRRH